VRAPLFVLVGVLLHGIVTADEVYLKGGGRLSGRIVTRTAEKIEVDVGAGLVGVPASSVLKIEEGRSALHDYEDRARQVAPDDADGWVALAEFAQARGLGTQSRQAYEAAVRASPSDPRANEALGNVLVDGRWLSEDAAYQARGYVRFEGEWVTAAEQEAMQRARAAEDEAERQRQASEDRVREAEARAEEAEARAREAEAQAESGTELWYGWGGVPAYWPVRPAVPPRVRPRAPR